MTSWLTSLLSDSGPTALIILMLVVFAETGLLIGFFLPGDSLLFAVGLLISAGSLPVPLLVAILGVWVAAAVGDQTGYWIGARLGTRLFAKGHSRWISERHLNAARVFFEKHGPKAVVLARFVPIARTFTPVVAGAVDMGRRRFLSYNVIGGLAWAASMLLAGYLLGGIPFIADNVDLIAIGAVAAAVVAAALGSLIAHRYKRRTDNAAAAEATSVR